MREIRFKINEDLFKKYKIFCVENDLSIPKQTSEMIRKFVELQEENKKRLQHIKR